MEFLRFGGMSLGVVFASMGILAFTVAMTKAAFPTGPGDYWKSIGLVVATVVLFTIGFHLVTG